MAVDADPANRDSMESTVPARRNPGHQQVHGMLTWTARQARWKAFSHR